MSVRPGGAACGPLLRRWSPRPRRPAAREDPFGNGRSSKAFTRARPTSTSRFRPGGPTRPSPRSSSTLDVGEAAPRRRQATAGFATDASCRGATGTGASLRGSASAPRCTQPDRAAAGEGAVVPWCEGMTLREKAPMEVDLPQAIGAGECQLRIASKEARARSRREGESR